MAKVTIALTPQAKDFLQLMWLSQIQGWNPKGRPGNESGEAEEYYTAELSEAELESIRKNPLIAGAYIKPPDALP
jgi:hypothetical protein